MAVIVNYKTQIQILQEWCWAAVASSISFKYSPAGGLTQSTLAGELIDQSCANITTTNADPTDGTCNVEFDLGQALIRTRNLNHVFDGYLSFQAICTEIDNGRPVGCQVFWPQHNNKSHFIALFGYIGNKIVIGDPEQDAGVCSLNYPELVQSYRGGQWKRSFYTRPPI